MFNTWSKNTQKCWLFVIINLTFNFEWVFLNTYHT